MWPLMAVAGGGTCARGDLDTASHRPWNAPCPACANPLVGRSVHRFLSWLHLSSSLHCDPVLAIHLVAFDSTRFIRMPILMCSGMAITPITWVAQATACLAATAARRQLRVPRNATPQGRCPLRAATVPGKRMLLCWGRCGRSWACHSRHSQGLMRQSQHRQGPSRKLTRKRTKRTSRRR